MADDRCRVFFALWPDGALRDVLAADAGQLPAARPIARDQLHITLLFLGVVTSAQRACLLDGAAAIRSPACELTLDSIGYWRRSQILWRGARQTPPALLQLVDALHRLAQGCGVEVGTRPFQVHMTLARRVERRPRWVPPVSVTWPVRHFVLVESMLVPQRGSPYRLCGRWALLG
ncbi:MAG: RNA 2',3'-cyclic phosphodiesterase [Gammaproteobacteria bacterium]|nr:RNA 2',3'-cyclic phosphodiesterase [Gammaproteobacteria bacterium]